MREKIALLVGGSLLAGAIAAQPLPCASVAAEVRDRVRDAGACRDATDGATPKAAIAPSATVTRKLSDGTIVRVPREISPDIDARKRAPAHETATAKGAAQGRPSMRSGPNVSGDPPLVPQKVQVPDLIGRSYADASSALGEFKIERIQTASAAPSGEVLAQEPAPASLVLPGSAVTLQVSDGSLAAAAGAGTAPTATNAPAAVPAPATKSAPASGGELALSALPSGQSATRSQFPIVFSANSAIILGVGVSLGLILGALLMRQWLLRHALIAEEKAAVAPRRHRNQPDDSVVGVSTIGAVPEVRFAARRDPAETTIELAPAHDEAVMTEQSSEKHG